MLELEYNPYSKTDPLHVGVGKVAAGAQSVSFQPRLCSAWRFHVHIARLPAHTERDTMCLAGGVPPTVYTQSILI
jgi:hypothetical protein